MAVERRVKPSTRMMAAIRRKRMIILGVIATTLVVAGVIFGVLYSIRAQERAKTMDTNAAALRALLSSRTNYEGNWMAGPDGLFEIYLPGEVITDSNFNSAGYSAEINTEYDNSCTKAFGVVIGKERFDVQLGDDSATILSSIMQDVVSDVARVHKGRNASGAYDVESLTMTDGRAAIRVEGNVTFTQLLQDPGGNEEPYQEENQQPMMAYITLEKGFPVAIWCTYNRDNYIISQEVPEQLLEVANTLWQIEYAGDKTEWRPVATTVGPDGVIIYEDDDPALYSDAGDEGSVESGLPEDDGQVSGNVDENLDTPAVDEEDLSGNETENTESPQT